MSNKEKIIIKSDDIEISEALRLVGIVIKGGKVSAHGESYCYGTVFNKTNIFVSCKQNKTPNSFTFYVYKSEM